MSIGYYEDRLRQLTMSMTEELRQKEPEVYKQMEDERNLILCTIRDSKDLKDFIKDK